MKLNPFIALLLILLAGCSHQMDHNRVMNEEHFLTEMIPHHQEAVDSSKLMLDSQNPQVAALAQRIITAQEQEIGQMRQWKAERYPGSRLKSSYENMMPDLEELEGIERDNAYLRGMIEHHRHAIQMAEQAQLVDLHPEARQLSLSIFTSQKAEIGEMEALLQPS